jgi:hypothetical protein
MDPEPRHDVLAQGPDGPSRSVPRWAWTLVMVVAVAVGLGWYAARPDAPSAAEQASPVAAPVPDRKCDKGERPRRPDRVDPVTDAGRPAGLADRDSRRLARTMRAFAHEPGPEAGMPWADRVLVLAEGPVDVNRVVSAAAADRVETWTDPPYLLSPLASTSAARLRVDDEHHVTCRGQPRTQAAGFEGRPWVSLQPRVLDNMCRGWWAVDLYLDDDGRVSAVLLRS